MASVATMTAPPVQITADVVRSLLREQHPDLAELPVTFAARGWDNQLWRLGDDLAVRLPWVGQSADALLRKEHAWLPVLAPRLPLPIPVPQRWGEPSRLFGRPWLVTTWVPGAPADRAPVTASSGADALAAFLTALHRPAPREAPTGRARGGALSEVADGVGSSIGDLGELGLMPDVEAVRAVWADALAAPSWGGPAVWLHGDLHPANVLTKDGELCGVVDFGDLCAGDPAFDIAACWILLPDDEAIARFRAAHSLALDAATWRRARGWAVWRAIGSLRIADAGRRGEPGGKTTWGPPAEASLRRLIAQRAA